MKPYDWGGLTPEHVADAINFNSKDPGWHYKTDSKVTMASKQAEGVAYLWNLLSRNKVALLADEVGMGKTFQALGVAAFLWKMKPDAKVLVMAPSRDICAHWQREYQAFVRSHDRSDDNSIKNASDSGPIQSIQTCTRLEDLAHSLEVGAGHLYLTTIHSLSGLVPQSEKEGDISKKAGNLARIFHERIKKALNGGGFDLIIIDEAHYFRNIDGGSQRVSAAKAFFGTPEDPLGYKTLLLTATPSHTRLTDVQSILGYFLDLSEESELTVPYLLQKYGLRRFRLMETDKEHYSKRHYRHEKGVPSDFVERPESEMFFALYQRKLVHELGFTKNNKSMLYGFLEGFESVGRSNSEVQGITSEIEDETLNSGKKDFSKAKDTDILDQLTSQFYKKFKKIPDHPKYGNLVDQCLPKNLFEAPRALYEDKHLVFVRRIPSVRELTQRINEAYDNVLAEKIYRAWGFRDADPAVVKWRTGQQPWSRTGFEELLQTREQSSQQEDVDLDEATVEEQEVDSRLGSSISDLFVVKKGKDGRTDCSNVSLRFRKPESAFSLFLEPASDYTQAGYSYYYEYMQGEKKRYDYGNAARDKRLDMHDRLVRKTESGKKQTYSGVQFQNEMGTAWSLMYQHLDVEQKSKIEYWAIHAPDIAENFANYVKTGFLFASPVMVELYCWFTEFNQLISENRTGDVQKRYLEFIEWVTPRITGSLMLCYFKSALATFEVLCEKIIDHKLNEWEKEWRSLTSLQNPAWYASGESGDRQRLILGFNSPFYPNVLIATSVFQEGVNLHLQCRKVHHYGIAGSPGANEQRVGRVDRLFGRINELLKKDASEELEINYPYLKNSFDEDQVGSFIAKKFRIDERMDACTQITFDSEVELSQKDWQQFLRKPDKDIEATDPYPAKFDIHSIPKARFTPSENHHDSEITSLLDTYLHEFIDIKKESIFKVESYPHNPHAMFLLDPVVNSGIHSIRRQPIVIERHFSADFSALVSGTVYYISLKSPVASKAMLGTLTNEVLDKIGGFCSLMNDAYPLARLTIDENTSMSHFYLCARVDLPVFVKNEHLSMLSRHELESAYMDVKNFSDLIERLLFSDKRDMKVEDLDLHAFAIKANSKHLTITNVSHPIGSMSAWQSVEGENANVVKLQSSIPFNKFSSFDLSEIGVKPEPIVHRMLVLNNRYPFVKFNQEANGIMLSINYPAEDLQLEEQLLLERWFKFITS